MSTQMVPMHSPEEYGSPKFVPAVPARYIRFGRFHLDMKKEELFKDGARVKLQGKVYQALAALLQKPGEIVTREELRLRLWPSGTYVNYDSNMNTTVNKLRQVLGDSSDQPAFVETIPRKGYSFVRRRAGVVRASLISRQLQPVVKNKSKSALPTLTVRRNSFHSEPRAEPVAESQAPLESAAEAQRVSVFAQGSDAEGDVLFQRHAKFFGALAHVFTRDALGKKFVFHAALHRIHFQIQNTF